MPPQLPHGSFLVDDADRLGLSVRQLSRDGILTPSRGIRLPLHSTGSVADNVRAYSRLDPTCVLTHSTSARICCICLPGWLDQDWRIHIARPADGCKPRRRNVVGHQLTFKPGEVVMFNGLRLTSPARTWLDLASLVSVDELVAAGDSIVVEHGEDFLVPRQPLAAIADLKGIVGRHPGMRGVRKARLALDMIRVGADSAPETMLAGGSLGCRAATSRGTALSSWKRSGPFCGALTRRPSTNEPAANARKLRVWGHYLPVRAQRVGRLMRVLMPSRSLRATW